MINNILFLFDLFTLQKIFSYHKIIHLFPYFLFHVLLVTLLELFQLFPPLPLSPQPAPHSHSQAPPRCPCPWVLNICSLTNPFTFFQSVPTSILPSYYCLFRGSMSPVLFFSLVYFVHYIPLTRVIIWFLSFSNCFIFFILYSFHLSHLSVEST